MKLKTILCTTLALVILNSCCWTDHSETIKEVAQPMLKELEYFYAKNKHFPDTQERNKMLEKAGCRVNGEICQYKNRDLEIYIWHTSYDYAIRLNFENTGCFFAVKNTGSVTPVNCGNSACIKLGQ